MRRPALTKKGTTKHSLPVTELIQILHRRNALHSSQQCSMFEWQTPLSASSLSPDLCNCFVGSSTATGSLTERRLCLLTKVREMGIAWRRKWWRGGGRGSPLVITSPISGAIFLQNVQNYFFALSNTWPLHLEKRQCSQSLAFWSPSSSGILNSREHGVSESWSVSVFRLGEGDEELNWVYVVTDGQSAYPSWRRAPFWGPWPGFSFSFLLLENCFTLRLGAPSLTRGRV
jgi:hypothetical protein